MNTHERLLQKYMKKYRDDGARVIRLDRRGVPDAIVIKDGKISALLIDTSTLNQVAGIIKHKKAMGQTIRNYSEYDEKIQVLPKFRKAHNIETYNSAIKLFKEGTTTYRISKTLNVPHTTVYEWCKCDVKPFSYIFSKDQNISNIIKEMLRNTTIIYDT